jgi:hypothetical protein
MSDLGEIPIRYRLSLERAQDKKTVQQTFLVPHRDRRCGQADGW